MKSRDPKQPSARARAAELEQRFRQAVSFQSQGRLSEADTLYRGVLAANPAHAGALHNLGFLVAQQGRPDEAIALLSAALRSNPRLVEAHSTLGVILQTRGRNDEARSHYEAALRLKPDHADAHTNLGVLLQSLLKHDEAAHHYQQALAIAPNNPATRRNLAAAFAETAQYESAAAQYRKAIALAPSDPQAYYGLCTTLMDDGRASDAVAALKQACSLWPANPIYRWQRCMAQLPVVYSSEDEIEGRRAAFAAELHQLADGVEKAGSQALVEMAPAVGQARPFYLAYQGRHDIDLQACYGRLVARVMAAAMPRYAEPIQPSGRVSRDRIRIGILSGFFRDHANWQLPIRGWVENLPRDRFALFGYHTGTVTDAVTAGARRHFDRFVQGPQSIKEWCETIRSDALDLLIVPETAMDPMTIALAALRLAPVQATSWGHPITSGFPSMDYFLSSALMEPPGAEADYTETLVRLPNLGVSFDALEVAPAADRAALGVGPEHVIYWSCQSLYKYLPQHDRVFADIAALVPEARFLFLRHPSQHVTALFETRLKQAFAARGLDSERYCHFLNRLGRREFAAVTATADIFLDNPGWSGCNSTFEAVACGTPIVAYAGDLMRSRHSAALLERMGLNEFVGSTISDFTAIAARLGSDRSLRNDTRQRIMGASPALYRDNAAIDGLVKFIENAVAGSRDGASA